MIYRGFRCLNVRTYFRCVHGFAPHNLKIPIHIGARDFALHARITARGGARVLVQHFSQYSPSIFIPPVCTHESPIREDESSPHFVRKSLAEWSRRALSRELPA